MLLVLAGLYNLSIIKSSLVGSFGDTSYQKDELWVAKKHYENVLRNLSGSTLLEADALYNLGNTLYKLGEEQKDADERVRLWTQAIGSYTKSLSIRVDTETEENLAFVKEKLTKEGQKQAEKNKQEREKDTEKKDDTKTDSGQTGDKEEQSSELSSKSWSGSSTGSGWEQKPEQPKQNWSNGGAYNSIWWTGSANTQDSLSDRDKQDIKHYLEGLKQFEAQNGKLLNPDKQAGVGSISDQIRNFFGNDSFFQDVLPTDEGKKDW